MPKRPDAASRISAARLSELCGVNRQTRDKWISKGLLQQSEGCDQFDLVELVVLNLLFGTVKKSHVGVIWREVQPKLRELMPGPRLALVWDPQTRAANLALDDATIAGLVRHGRPVHVLDLGGPIELARAAFKREVGAMRPLQPARRFDARRAASRRGPSRGPAENP
jgi:hypothetical protein